MKKILFINACIRPCSRTYLLAKKVLEKSNGEITEIKLTQEDLLPFNWERLQTRDHLISTKNFSSPIFRHAHQFAEADEIILAAPYWDLAFPSILRVYFEHITVCGLTFKYSAAGTAIGLCNAKRIIYITTGGGPIPDNNPGYEYIKSLAEIFYGIPELLYFKAENLDIQGTDVPAILEKTIDEINRIL